MNLDDDTRLNTTVTKMLRVIADQSLPQDRLDCIDNVLQNLRKYWCLQCGAVAVPSISCPCRSLAKGGLDAVPRL